MSDKIEVHLFTDGACSGNPGPGGWGYILRHLPSGKEMEDSGGCAESTNNRMELQAVVEGLSVLKRPCSVELFTDSVYVGKGISEWMVRWKQNGWKRKEKSRLVPVKNEDLWRRLDAAAQPHEVDWRWIKGHAGHAENERCDALARAAIPK